MGDRKQEIKKIIEGTGKIKECDFDTFFNDIEYSCFSMNTSCDEFIYFQITEEQNGKQNKN